MTHVLVRCRTGALVCAAALLLTGSGNCVQAQQKPDPEKIRTTVEALERERQEQALKELERLRMRRVDMVSRTQYARQWVLSNYQFDMYSLIREPRVQDERLVAETKQRLADRGVKLSEQQLLEYVEDPELRQYLERSAVGELKRRKVEFSPKRMRYNIMKQLEAKQVHRDAFLFRLLSRDTATQGSIVRGTALNFFLDKLGAPAFDHALYRELTKQKQSLAEPDRPATLLDQGSAGAVVLDEKITRHIRYSRGVFGNKETGRLNEGPLDLAWPAVLRRDAFKTHRDSIEKARDKALAELRSDKPMSNATSDQLLDAVKSLMKLVNEEKRKWMGTGRGEELWSWVLAERHAKLLMGGAYRLIEARGSGDVVVETFKSGTIEDLIAFMYRNNLRFVAADANGETAYRTIAEMMMRYYADIEALRAAVAEMGSPQEQEALLVELGLSNPARGGNQPNLGEEGAQAVLNELKEFDSKQPKGEKVDKPKGK